MAENPPVGIVKELQQVFEKELIKYSEEVIKVQEAEYKRKMEERTAIIAVQIAAYASIEYRGNEMVITIKK